MRSLITAAIAATLATTLCTSAPAAPGQSGLSTTLVIYDAPARPFSLVNEIAPIQLMLSSFETAVVTRKADEVTADEIAAANYLVVAGMAAPPPLGPAARSALARSSRPLLAIGWAATLAGAPEPDFHPAVMPRTTVAYRGLEWKMMLDPFFPGPTKKAVALATPAGTSRPLIWQSGSKFGFGTLPGTFPASALFSDLLNDFYGTSLPRPHGLFFAIRNFHPGSDPRSLRRLVDYLTARKAGFVVSTQLDNVPGTSLMPREDFLSALRYARSRGGRIVLRGSADPAIPQTLVEAGLSPAGWELPEEGGAPPPAALTNGRHGYLLGTLLADPREPASAFQATTVLITNNGWPVLPLNINPPTGEPDELRAVAERVAELASLRDSVAGVAIPAWLPFQQMRDIVDAAQSTRMPSLQLENLGEQ